LVEVFLFETLEIYASIIAVRDLMGQRDPIKERENVLVWDCNHLPLVNDAVAFSQIKEKKSHPRFAVLSEGRDQHVVCGTALDSLMQLFRNCGL